MEWYHIVLFCLGGLALIVLVGETKIRAKTKDEGSSEKEVPEIN